MLDRTGTGLLSSGPPGAWEQLRASIATRLSRGAADLVRVEAGQDLDVRRGRFAETFVSAAGGAGGISADASARFLAIDGRAVGRPRRVTILLNKPRGVVTTSRDPEGRPTVLDFVRDAPTRVVPVGRLDLASTGLLLLTNDSRFASWLTDPSNGIARTYAVTVRGALADEARSRLEAGIDVAGERLHVTL